MEEFQLKTDQFEGPLDLLLDLIERRKLHINDISLAQVTDDYIAYLRRFADLPMETTANFIVIASTLILIKSYSLIASLQVTPEEQESIEDLERRLKLYSRIKDLSLYVKEMFGKRIIFPREPGKSIAPVFTPSAEVTVANLLTAAQTVITNLPKAEKLPQTIIKKIISLEEVITDLTKRVSRAFKMKFSEFVADKRKERVNVIVSFLGMLELVKQGIIDVKQNELFQEIDMESRAVGTPRYD